MIDDFELRKILKDNNLTFPRRVRNSLKKDAELEEVIEILSILKKLNISSSIIEKYPSILYVSSNNIKDNYKLLKENGLYNYNQEELIQILLTDNERLKNNFDYIANKYGTYEINRNILVLTVPVQKIKNVEKYEQILTPEVLLSAMTSNHTDEEIYDIILTCLRNNIDVTPNVFKRTAAEIKTMIKMCKEEHINISDSIFTKTPKELNEIIKMCIRLKIVFYNDLIYCPMDKIESLLASFVDNKIEIKGVLATINNGQVKEVLNLCERFNIDIDYKILRADPNKIEKIIAICNKYNVKVSRSMFTRTLTDVEDIIKYCKDKDIIVRDTYFKRTKREIENIHQSCGLSLKRDDTTYKRDLKEIIDILVFCKENDIKFSSVLLNNNLDEIERIINTCKKRHVQVSNGVFRTNHKDLDRIISILKQQPLVIPFTPMACNRTPYEVKRIKEIVIESKVRMMPEMFLRTPYEVEKIIRLTKNSLDPKYFLYPLSKLENILSFCNSKDIKLSPSMLSRTTGEIEDLIEICKNKNIEITDSVYQRTPFELEEIINYCEEKKMPITGGCFIKNPEQFKEAVETCEKLNIPAEGEVFNRTPDEIKAITKIYERMLKKDPINNSFATTPEEVEKIISLLTENNIEITGVVFRKKTNELADTIEHIKKKYGNDYLLPQIIIYDKNQIDRIFSYCSGRGCMDVIKTCPYILRLTLYEIVERDSYINSIGGTFIEDGKFNSVFSWSRKKFLEEKEKLNQNQDSSSSKK